VRRTASGFKVRPYDIPRGPIAAYYAAAELPRLLFSALPSSSPPCSWVSRTASQLSSLSQSVYPLRHIFRRGGPLQFNRAPAAPRTPSNIGGGAEVGGEMTQKMRQKLKRAGYRSRYRLRKQIVEPVFGQIKQARGFRQFLLRGLEAVQAEWALICTAHNITKLAKAI
jgi:DDE family transposase